MADTSLIFNIIARDQASSKMDKIKSSAKLLGVAVGVMALKFGKDSVAAFTEAQQSQDKLQFALGKFPKLADTNIGRLDKLNSSLALKTKFDDDATASGQAVLAQFVDTGKQLEDLTPLMQDFAAKTGRDLPTAAGLMGKAFLGNTRALKDLGINYKTTGDKTQDMANITALMQEKVGGFATNQGKSAAGQAAILGNQFGELEESVGSKLVPALTRLAGILLQVIGFVQKNGAVIGPVVAIAAAFAGVVWLIITAQKAWIAVQAALNIVMSANPIGLVIIAIAALVAIVILAYRHSETFRSVTNAAFRGVSDAAQAMWGVLKSAFSFIVGAFLDTAGMIIHTAASAFGWVPGLGGKLKAAASAFDVFRDSVNASLDGIKDKTVHVNVAVGGSGRYAGKVIPRAMGGPVVAGTPYIVGENNPELFVPSTNGQIMPHVPTSGGGGTMNVTINMPPGSDGADVVKQIQEYERRNGSSWRAA